MIVFGLLKAIVKPILRVGDGLFTCLLDSLVVLMAVGDTSLVWKINAGDSPLATKEDTKLEASQTHSC